MASYLFRRMPARRMVFDTSGENQDIFERQLCMCTHITTETSPTPLPSECFHSFHMITDGLLALATLG